MQTSPETETSDALVQIGLEMWKLLRSFERTIEDVPAEKRARRIAQWRYSRSRLDSIIDHAGFKILTFDGEMFSANLPVTPINADEIDNPDGAFIESTLEPTIVGPVSVLHVGKIMLSGDKNVSGN